MLLQLSSAMQPRKNSSNLSSKASSVSSSPSTPRRQSQVQTFNSAPTSCQPHQPTWRSPVQTTPTSPAAKTKQSQTHISSPLSIAPMTSGPYINTSNIPSTDPSASSMLTGVRTLSNSFTPPTSPQIPKPTTNGATPKSRPPLLHQNSPTPLLFHNSRSDVKEIDNSNTLRSL